MQKLLTVEEAAEALRLEPVLLARLVDDGEVRAYSITGHLRIDERDLEEYVQRCVLDTATGKVRQGGATTAGPADEQQALPTGQPPSSAQTRRPIPTRRGRTVWVVGSVKDGAAIWMGQMRYPLRLTRDFFADLLHHFRGQTVPVGSVFSGPTPGSLGHWVQEKLETKMNPTYAIAALLVAEGYAEWSKPGYIRFLHRT